MSKPQIQIGVFQFMPDVSPCYLQLLANPKKCPHPGTEMEILMLALKILKWNYTFVQADDFGYQIDLKNLTRWNGLVGNY
jgi:hypothetical protein